ncbi:hypothetical protein [Streptomyces sp. AC512_CC834]|uniref:hypothetical protein n=1 Tax=Streptomyces sp. AC512_CC834 TaxID=2823691 RepID=UPI001C26D825|nr:hypothetical protein [Streptomyces sp. AC512_CC834]
MAWLLVAVATLVTGVVSAGQVGRALDREREYRAAPVSASAPVRASGCLWEQEFTVRTAGTHRGERGRSPEAELLPPSGRSWEVTFRATEPVMSELEPDDEVVGVIWHGRVVEVRDADGRRQQTSAGPVEMPEGHFGGALACLPVGLTALVGGLWPLFARRDPRHAKAAAVVRWHGVGMGGAAVLTLWAQESNDWPLWAIPAIWGPSPSSRPPPWWPSRRRRPARGSGRRGRADPIGAGGCPAALGGRAGRGGDRDDGARPLLRCVSPRGRPLRHPDPRSRPAPASRV